MSDVTQQLETNLQNAATPRQKIDAANALAWELLGKDDQRALTLAEEAERLIAEEGVPYPEGRMRSLRIICHVYYHKGRYGDSLARAFDALSLTKKVGDDALQPFILSIIATNYRTLGNISESLEYHSQQYAISQKLEDTEGIARSLIGIGTIHHDTGDYKRASDYFLQSLNVFREIGDTYWIALSLNNVSSTYIKLKQYDKALAYALESKEIGEIHNHQRIQIYVAKTLGEVYIQLGQLDEAIRALDNISELSRNMPIVRHEIDRLRLLGRIYNKQGNYAEALTHLHKGLTLAIDADHKYHQSQLHEALSAVYENSQDFERALQHHKQFHTIQKAFLGEESNQKLQNLEVLYRTETAKKEADYHAALAAESQSLLQESEQRTAELATINRISQALAAELEFDALIYLVGEQIRQTFTADIVFVALHDQETNMIHFPYEYGETTPPIPFGEGLTSRIIESKQPLLENEDVDTRYAELDTELVGDYAESFLGVPIMIGNEAIGVISVQTTGERGHYTETDLNLLSAIAATVGAALNNARLYRQSRRQNEQIRKFNEQLEAEVANRTAALQEAYQQMEQLNRTKSEFIAVTAHELRTPLTILMGYGQLLEEDPLLKGQSHQQTLISGILSGSQRLHEVINTMLMMVRIDSHELELHHEHVHVGKMVNKIMDDLKADLAARKQTAVIASSLQTLPSLTGDGEALMIVFSNIIRNAIKYTPDNGRIAIDGVWNDADQTIEIIVSDSGIGIPANALELIFTKFYQTGKVTLHSSGKTKFKGGGPGLGLAIARGIINAHGGKLWAESPGYDEVACPGSLFHILLPQSPPPSH